jgi:hypothetical protein
MAANHRAFLISGSVLLWSSSIAWATEQQLLNAINSGSVKLDTKVALPSTGNEAPPFPGSDNKPDPFLFNLTKAEEKNIVDKAYPLMAAKWPFNIISVCWENPETKNDMERGWVQSAVTDTWEASSALQFKGWGKCESDTRGVRISIDDSGPHTNGLGKFLRDQHPGMVLNFTFKNWSPVCADNENQRKSCIYSIAVHEFGHSIGFAHEQNRPDTPGECTQAPQGQSGDRTDITPWDPKSVMNYCNSTYNNDGKLSEFDIKAVRYVYGVKQ